jgi:hypothetical protein
VDTYPLDPDQLASLFVDRGSTEALKELGGVDEIANSLKVQLNRGVSKDSIEYRIHRYKTNRSFLHLRDVFVLNNELKKFNPFRFVVPSLDPVLKN